MKSKFYTLSVLLAFVVGFEMTVLAQDTIVQWTFPSESGLADKATVEANLLQSIETAGGTSEIQFKNGSTTKAAQATQWENGFDSKKWKVEFETTGYKSIKLSSKITSGGQNPGPRDFKVQYKADGDWTDVENGSFTTANDWTTGVLDALLLPGECNDQSLVKIRWIMTSDTATDGSILGIEGISKIDDIFLVGDIQSGNQEIEFLSSIRIFPNPTTDFINIVASNLTQVRFFDLTGKKLLSFDMTGSAKMDVTDLKSGIYVVSIEDVKSGLIVTRKILIN